MAQRTFSAFATVADLPDGAAGVSILISNENHAFATDAAGAIPPAELALFHADISVLLGANAYAYTDTGALSTGQWRVADGAQVGADAIEFTTGAGLGATLTTRGAVARLTLQDLPAAGGFADADGTAPSVIVDVPVEVRHGTQTITARRSISLTKSTPGTGGMTVSLLRLTATARALLYTGDGTLQSASEPIVFDAGLFNIAATAGDVRWEYRLGPEAGWTALPDGDGFTRSLSQDRRLAATREALARLMGSALNIQIRASILSNVFDLVSVYRVQDGEPGKGTAELHLVPRTSPELLNNAGSVIFDARLFFDGQPADPAVRRYQWLLRENNANILILGATASFHEFRAREHGSGSRLIGCTVTYDDSHESVNN